MEASNPFLTGAVEAESESEMATEMFSGEEQGDQSRHFDVAVGVHRRKLTITKLERDPDHGFWRARVTLNGGPTVDVDRRYGSWQTAPGRPRQDITPEVASALQDKVRPIENAERKAAEEAAKKSKGAGGSGTFTISHGTGTSDPLPYDASGAQAQEAFEQAIERHQENIAPEPPPQPHPSVVLG